LEEKLIELLNDYYRNCGPDVNSNRFYKMIDYSGAFKIGRTGLEEHHAHSHGYQNKYRLVAEKLVLPVSYRGEITTERNVNTVILINVESRDVIFTRKAFIKLIVIPKCCECCGLPFRS